MIEVLLEILKYGAPAMLVLLGMVLMVRSILSHNERLRGMELSLKSAELNAQKFHETLPLRLQAYERLVLYLERLSPTSLINRTRMEDMTAPELQMAMVATIRMEFEHNLAQQLYVSADAWEMLRTVTEESITIINNIASRMDTDATGNDLSRALLEFYLTSGHSFPSQKAALVLKSEALQLMG
ncbi:MAG: hypothetical protein IPL33_07605 [Sphingobacteriales bacterium]|jgi:hypothetical protein|nr:hypothetical protein [Sphingobacteriales bacterium]